MIKLRLALLAVALSLAAPALASDYPSVEGRAYLVQNGVTGELLFRANERDRVPIASITKVMTVLVTLERARLDEVVTVGYDAASVGESSIHLRPGEQLTVLDLVKAALIQSANDAAYALASHVGRGSVERFVGLMNARARKAGLRDTQFVRPDGLDAEGHYSSARDVTRLARIAMRLPAVREIVAERTDRIAGGRTLRTWNDLLGTFPGLIGVKTGHTSGAGWSEVAAARGGGVTVYATLLGSPSRAKRNDDLAELLAWGLARYRRTAVVATSRIYGWARAPYGRKPLSIVAPRRIVRIVRVDRPLVERVVVPAAVSLPVARGQRVGEVRVYDGERLVARSPLVATRAIAKPGFLGRSGWYARRTAGRVWGWL
ncbi:MAG: D-alanyl-D-alanine carboxypeptidase family protein [Gaiellaceae bacterium]